MAKKPDGQSKVTVLLPKELARCLDQEAKKLDLPNRAAALADVVRRFFRGRFGGRYAARRQYEEVIGEAAALKARGTGLLKAGDAPKARKCFLRAASKELEALSLLEDPGEDVISSSLIEACSLMKDGTGYKHLPSVPPKHRDVGLSVV